MSQPSDASNEPLEVKLITAASDGMVNVTPEKSERIRKLLQSPPLAPAASEELRDPKVTQILARWKQWKGLYPADYIKRFFTAYDGELEALIALASSEQAALKGEVMTTQLKEKELTVANHIRVAAGDGCMCEPCIAARESQAAPDEEQIHIRIRNVLAVIYGGAPMDNLSPEVQSLVKHWREQAASSALAEALREVIEAGEALREEKLDSARNWDTAANLARAALEGSGLPGKGKE